LIRRFNVIEELSCLLASWLSVQEAQEALKKPAEQIVFHERKFFHSRPM
jgi:hypothetical protein